jgi:hypothetical protein
MLGIWFGWYGWLGQRTQLHSHGRAARVPPQRCTPLTSARPLAVQGEPLRRYFYGLYSQADLSAFEANMYLAEDRVLCLEIVARKNGQYL